MLTRRTTSTGPLIAAGNATPEPELDELKEKARKFGQNVDWDKQERFKRPRAGVVASTPSYYPPTEEPFGKKLSRAISNQLPGRARLKTQKRAKEQARIVPISNARYRSFLIAFPRLLLWQSKKRCQAG